MKRSERKLETREGVKVALTGARSDNMKGIREVLTGAKDNTEVAGSVKIFA